MTDNTDTAIALAYKAQLITTHMSVDTCKECPYLTMKDKGIKCTLLNLNKEDCNLLKIYL